MTPECREVGEVSSIPSGTRMTPEGFLAWEREQQFKHEYYAGEVVARSGGIYEHSLIAANTTGVIFRALQGSGCRTLQSDMRIWIATWETFVHPDITVVCGSPEFFDGRRDTLTNPVLIIEVLSPSTERYDRSEKFLGYLSLPSLKEYVMVSQDKKLIEQYVRDGNAWRYVAWFSDSERVELKSVPAVLAFGEVYEGVEVPPGPRG
jgi:Uma2 family endonuclease